MKVAYHDPCDLGRHLNIFEPPRNIVKSIPGVTLVEFKNNRLLAKCCGGGGGLKAFNNELSERSPTSGCSKPSRSAPRSSSLPVRPANPTSPWLRRGSERRRKAASRSWISLNSSLKPSGNKTQ